ncbi:MAG: methyltransferase domain-containing protein [Planctomycetes bacterium]|nr:methyltransferase domain-containing protein [Planctomycetota bacterium]
MSYAPTIPLDSHNREVGRRFDEIAGEFDRISNPYTLARRAQALARFVRGSSIEIGGGTAAVTASLADRSRAWHSDISAKMCGLARVKLNLPSVCFDAEQIPLSRESFDSIVSAEMIYYLKQPERFIAEAYRVLKPGGRLILSTTNPMMAMLDQGRSLLRRLGFGGMFFDDGSPRFIALHTIRELLLANHFTIEHVGGIVPMPFARFDWLNRILERTPLWRLSLFLIIVAGKPPIR